MVKYAKNAAKYIKYADINSINSSIIMILIANTLIIVNELNNWIVIKCLILQSIKA